MRARDYGKELRRIVWERGERRCGICTLPIELQDVHLDHIQPIALGGADSWENLQSAHKSCNSRKGTKDKPIEDPSIIHVSLRVPRSLRDALVRLAESEHRSMHGQVVHLIEQATGKVDTVRRRSRRAAAARQDGGEG